MSGTSLSDYAVSVIRTVVPTAVGLGVAKLALLGIDVDQAAVETVVLGLGVGGYHAIVRKLEEHFPRLGWLLGYKASPSYTKE